MNAIVTQSWLSVSNLVQIAILITGVLGAILVARRNILGFWSWIASNLMLIIVCIQQELWGMAGMYVFYLCTCVYSILYWKNHTGCPEAAKRG